MSATRKYFRYFSKLFSFIAAKLCKAIKTRQTSTCWHTGKKALQLLRILASASTGKSKFCDEVEVPTYYGCHNSPHDRISDNVVCSSTKSAPCDCLCSRVGITRCVKSPHCRLKSQSSTYLNKYLQYLFLVNR